jgi:type IV secretion system protein VirB9
MVECRSLKGMDNRVCVVPYSEKQVVHTFGTLRSMLIVKLGDDESDLKLVAADSSSITTMPYGNYMIIKPKRTVWGTQPITILSTNKKTGKIRSHVIQLDFRDGPIDEAAAEDQDANSPRPQLVVQYTYPDEAAAAAREKAQERAVTWQARKASAELAQSSGGPTQTCSYFEQHDPSTSPQFIPISTCDDGQSTTMTFPGNMPIPSIFMEGPDGKKEATTMKSFNSSTNEMTIHQVSRHFWLRIGDALVCVWKVGPMNPAGYNPGTGTASPNVQRVLKAAAQ